MDMPKVFSGAGDVPSRQNHDPGLRGDVIQTHQLEHPSTRSTASSGFAVIFVIYHGMYSAAWLIGFIVLADYTHATRWIPVIVTGAICVSRLHFHAQFLLGGGMGLYYVSCSRQVLKRFLSATNQWEYDLSVSVTIIECGNFVIQRSMLISFYDVLEI